MKKAFLSSMVMIITIASFAQHATVSKDLQEYSVKTSSQNQIYDLGSNVSSNVMRPSKSALYESQTEIGITKYDLQSNAALSNRGYRYPDGSMAYVWTMGLEPTTFSGRGAGYNFYDGTFWDANPTTRVEDDRCGWPSYAPLGENGEIIVSHGPSEGLKISTRQNRGAGLWSYSTLENPDGYIILWPRMCTNGNSIHLLACCPNVGNGGQLFEGLNGALLYSRSLDGGITWEDENLVLDGLSSNDIYGISADNYILAAQGNTVVIVHSDAWNDLIIMKSVDNGETWTKIVPWANPYNNIPLNDLITTDTLYAPDGSMAADIDSEGKVHITFGISRYVKEAEGDSWNYFPYTDGIIYWNEDMPVFEADNQHDALKPANLVTDETYVGWTPDMNANGTLDISSTDELYSYRTGGMSSQLSMVFDEFDNLFMVYTAPHEELFSGVHHYRHIFSRHRTSSGQWGAILDVVDGDFHMFNECIFPQLLNILPGDETLHLLYQQDIIPGLALDDAHDWIDNSIIYTEIAKADFGSADIQVTPASLTITEPTDAKRESNDSTIEGELIEVDFEQYLTTFPDVDKAYKDTKGNIILRHKIDKKPPVYYNKSAALTEKQVATSTTITGVPAYDWSFGCSATSAAMYAAYYDNQPGYGNVYTGPGNGGVMPMTNSIWPDVVISDENRHQCPLSASRQGLDERTTRGHVDDYWIAYGNADDDPYITNGWTEHEYGDCLADYMGTSQSQYNSSDGSTWFYSNASGYPLYDETLANVDLVDGCHGIREFFEARGFTVLENFNQRIYGYDGVENGFTFDQFKDEIDNGNPVIINVTGHTMIATGYDDANNTIVIHNTWDYSQYTMEWGGTYEGMQHYMVSVIHLAEEEDTESITIQNIGGEDLLVTDITGDVDWLVLEDIPQLPFSLAPGASSSFDVVVDWEFVDGQSFGKVMVNSNDPDESQSVVNVTAIPNYVDPSLQPLDVNVDIEGNEAIVTWEEAPTGEAYEIIYDDGVVNNATAWNAGYEGNMNAIRFTPSGYPCQINKAKLHIYDGTWPMGDILNPMEVVILDDDGDEGLPGTELGSVTITPANYNWIEIDLSSFEVSIDDGDFYIANRQISTYPNCPPTGIAQNTPAGRSYAYTGGVWDVASYDCFMIRAEVISPMGQQELSYADDVEYPKQTTEEAVSKNISGIVESVIYTIPVSSGVIEKRATKDDPDHFEVYRLLSSDSLDMGNWMQLDAFVQEMQFVDSQWGSLPADEYQYAVKAVYPTNESTLGYSNTVTKEMSNHFTPIWDGNAYQPMTFMVGGAAIDDIQLETGDEVAVFDGDLCVGAGILDHTLDPTDDQDFIQITASKNDGGGNGFTEGNPITYRIWDASEQIEKIVTTVLYPYDPLYTFVDFASLETNFVVLEAVNTIDQTVNYQTGWNMVSYAVQMEDMGMQNIMQPLMDNESLVKVIDEQGNIIEYMPWGWVDNIGDMMLTEGYYVKVSSDESTTLTGEPVLLPYDIPLLQGWNMTGYPTMTPQNSSDVMADLINDGVLVKVIDQQGNIIEYMPWGWVDNIGTFNPGQGYYVKVNADATLTINEPALRNNLNEAYRAPLAEYFQTIHAGNAYQPMTVVLDVENLELELGDELALYSSGICVGAAGYNPAKAYQYITANTDDPTTTAVDGFVEGDEVQIQVYHHESQMVYGVEYNVIKGQSSYGTLSTMVAKATEITTGNENMVSSKLILEQNRPNPMTDESVITYTIPSEGFVKLEIYNMQGMLQQQLVEAYQSSGKYDVILKSNTLDPGMYVYRLTFKTASEKSAVLMKKMTVLR